MKFKGNRERNNIKAVFSKLNKINKFVTILTRKKKTQIIKTATERGVITVDPINIKEL